jgi:hypothetical protein
MQLGLGHGAQQFRQAVRPIRMDFEHGELQKKGRLAAAFRS